MQGALGYFDYQVINLSPDFVRYKRQGIAGRSNNEQRILEGLNRCAQSFSKIDRSHSFDVGRWTCPQCLDNGLS
jgi:hypothetical protein